MEGDFLSYLEIMRKFRRTVKELPGDSVKRLLLLGLALALLLPAFGLRRRTKPELRIAAAADLGNAFRELAPMFEKKTGASVTLTFGSTGLLAKQAENSAPFDLLAAADEDYIKALEGNGKVLPGTRQLYAVGRLVVWTPQGKPRVRSMRDLATPGYRRIAIANPQHAPYGRAAREALEHSRIWNSLEPRLIYGENVMQTMQFARSGNADAALIALSLAIGARGSYLTVSEKLHSPLRQAMGVLAQSENPDLARRFASFVNGPTGRPIMRKYGFTLPGERAD